MDARGKSILSLVGENPVFNGNVCVKVALLMHYRDGQ